MHYDSYVPNLSAFHESSIYDDLSKKSKQYYEEYTPEYYTIEEGEIKKNFEEKTKKTIHGVKHYEAVRFLSEKLSEIFNIPKDNFGFVKLLAMYHDASRLHEREDKEELPNGEMFYRDASEFNIPENEKILGGLLISLKGELSNIMADKNKEQTTEIIKQFLEGVEKPLNGITITKKTSDISADEWYLLIKEHFINHLSALNLADTIDVVRVRFAKEEDAKITEKEIAKHKLNFFETGELNLKMVLKKVPNNTLINTKSEAEYKVRNLIKTHFTRVIEDEKRYFPEFRRYEIKFKDFKQEITNHIKDYPEKETKLIEEFLKNMTGQNTKELESLENFMQSYENKAMEEAQKKQNQLFIQKFTILDKEKIFQF